MDDNHAADDAEMLMRLSAARGASPYTLDRVLQAYHKIDSPLKGLPVVLVGGTNGKGTTCGLLALLLRYHGLRVGLYTSPHVMNLTERCQISGVQLGIADLIRVGHVVEGLLSDLEFKALSAFELMSLVSFKLMAMHKIDVAVVEVGMGGEYDATNVLDPWVSVLTSIGHDHMPELGDSLVEVAATKAGIRRLGRPLIIAQDATSGGELHQFWRQLDHDQTVMVMDSTHCCRSYWRGMSALRRLPLNLDSETFGQQVSPALQRNSATVWRIYVELMKQMNSGGGEHQVAAKVKDQECVRSPYELPYVVHGRGQWMRVCGVSYFVDTAHNPQAFKVSLAWFKQAVARVSSSAITIGLMHFRRDKQPAVLLTQALQVFDHVVVFGGDKYSVSAEILDDTAADHCEYYELFHHAWPRIKAWCSSYNQLYIYVGGSFFAVKSFLAQEFAQAHPLNHTNWF